MTLFKYDETRMLLRLGALSSERRRAFAASCAQLLLPLFERYARMSNEPDKLTRLDAVMATVWDVVDGVPADLTGLQIDVNELTPSEESPWEFEFGYAENAVSAVAYAVSTCSSGDPQDAVWAGRQVYEVAEYAARKGEEGIEIASTGEYQVALKGHIIQGSLALLESLLGEVERAEFTSDMLRSRVVAEGCDWVNRLP